MKNEVLFSTDLWTNFKGFDDCKREFEEVIMENKGYENPEEITDEDVFEEFNFVNEINFDDTIRRLEKHFDSLPCEDFLVVASCGTWRGTFPGGKILSNFGEIRTECFCDYDDLTIGCEDNCLTITGCHHDGKDYFKVYQLTKKGQDYVDRHYYDMSDQELHEHLMSVKGHVKTIFSKVKYLEY